MSDFRNVPRFLLYILMSFTLAMLPEIIQGGEVDRFEKEWEKMKQSKEYPMYVSTIQFILWQMGYFDLPPISGKMDLKTREAIKKYQNQRGLSVTGDINEETFNQFDKDSDFLNTEPIQLGFYRFSRFLWDRVFSAEGTWVFEDEKEKMAHPLQTTKIECWHDPGICIEATADVTLDNNLDLTIELYDIERWDEYEIVTNPYDYGCVRYVLRINRHRKTVKKLRTTLRTKDICKGIDVNDKYINLVDGFDVWWKIKEKQNEAHGEIWSDALRILFEKNFKTIKK